MNILVTGGAGYIGSAIVKLLIAEYYHPYVIDNLSGGQKKHLPYQTRFFKGDLTDTVFLNTFFEQNHIDAVIHMAAYKDVGESIRYPEKYQLNVIGTQNLLNCMQKHQVHQLVFSSTAAVYGEPTAIPITEAHALKPLNPYGSSKETCEKIIQKASEAFPLKFTIFRYFNVIGDAGMNYLDPKASNLVPILMEASLQNSSVSIFGTDYDTPDGTCIRDYIDVQDIAKAHLMALKNSSQQVINLGTEKGTSVQEMIKLTEQVTQKNLQVQDSPRREGDPAEVVASNKKAKEVLGWQPVVRLEESLQNSWRAYQHQAESTP